MQSATSRIWTLVTKSISYDNNHYATSNFLNGQKFTEPKTNELEGI